MLDMVLPSQLKKNCTHHWNKFSIELGKEKDIISSMLNSCLPDDPFQHLIDQKAGYLQAQQRENQEWNARPTKYPIVMCLPFILQKPHQAAVEKVPNNFKLQKQSYNGNDKRTKNKKMTSDTNQTPTNKPKDNGNLTQV